MNKLLLCLVACLVLANCDINARRAAAEPTPFNNTYRYHEEAHSGMVYGVWSVYYNSSQTGYAISTVNLTKEKLEVELLRKQVRAMP